jgi:hypothetical protein
MTPTQAKRIEEIIRSQDVRDPRETLDAISAVLDKTKEVPHLVPDDPKNDFGNPVATLRIYNLPNRPDKLKTAIAFEGCNTHIRPRHIIAAINTLHKFADNKSKENAE